MYPNKIAMVISSIILKDWRTISSEIDRINSKSLQSAFKEETYFRTFFMNLENYINSIQLSSPAVHFSCRTKEIHKKPIVKFRTSGGCEIGDFFVIVKYIYNGRIIGQKAIIYQFKFSKGASKWNIDQRQLRLLRDWPPFSFGRKNVGNNSFSIKPTTPEFGSYWLADKRENMSYFFTSYDIDKIQSNSNVKICSAKNAVRIFTPIALLSQIAWRLGELIVKGSDIEKFVNTLYRYLSWTPDPAKEFNGFYSEKNESNSFFGVEILVKSEGKETRQ